MSTRKQLCGLLPIRTNDIVNVSATEDLKTTTDELIVAQGAIKKIQGKVCNFL